MADIAEIMLAHIWNAQWLVEPLRTLDGRSVRVVYRGVWTHGFGPDFTDAMVDLDGTLVTGDIEIDVTTSGWSRHGHQSNPAFDHVVLHLVTRTDSPIPVRRSDGGSVPTVKITEFLRGPLDDFDGEAEVRPLGAIGFDHCAPAVAASAPDDIRDVWQRAGDRRMDAKVSAISGELALEPPAQTLYRRLLDAMGYNVNRKGMEEVMTRLPFDDLAARLTGRRPHERWEIASALLLGVAGFIPLSPSDQRLADLTPEQTARIERRWSLLTEHRAVNPLAPHVWRLARTRPAAHPLRRLLAMATMLGATGEGLVEALAELLDRPHPHRALRDWLCVDNPYLGEAHAHEIIVNVIVPFAFAYGQEAAQQNLVDAAARLWDELPAGRGNAVIRRTIDQICGDHRVAPGSARAEQGLIQINREGCSRMRCYECPIAHLALTWTDRSTGQTEGQPEEPATR